MKNMRTEHNNLTQLSEVGEISSPTLLRFLKSRWLRHWQGNPPGTLLLLFCTLVALIMSIPVVYVVWRSLAADSEKWLRLLDDRIPQLLWNTLSLSAAVTVSTLVIGVSAAWIVMRTDIPGGNIWRWLLAMPLLIPPYVGAVTYIIVLGRSGWLRNYWLASPLLTRLSSEYPLNIFSFWGVFFVLTMFTYPYVFLLSGASLRKMNRNFEDAARVLGMNTAQIFWKVNLPFLRPAAGAGAILVALYVLSDFGAVSMLRYVTFTAAIYFQRRSFDTAAAAVLSLVLILLTVFILWLEGRTRAKIKYYQTGNSYREPALLPLGNWKAAALIYLVLIFTVSVLLPLSVLVYWSRIGIAMGALDARFFGFVWNSIKVSGLAALVCMFAAMPVVYLKSRYPSFLTSLVDRMSYAGYALPGVIVALGFIFLFNNHLPVLYSTVFMLALAFVVRFLPQAMQAGEASLSLVSPRIDEAARSLGYPPWKVMLRVILPNMLPGVLAGGALVFVSSIKELPVTLMLRPPGFDTLAVRVFFEAGEALYHYAAPGALLIIFASLLPLRYMLSKY